MTLVRLKEKAALVIGITHSAGSMGGAGRFVFSPFLCYR